MFPTALTRARKGTKRIESTDDIEGFDDLEEADQETLRALCAAVGQEEEKAPKKKATKRKAPAEKKVFFVLF